MRTLSLFGGPYSTVMVVFTLLLTGIVGAMVGANEAAAGGEPVDLFELPLFFMLPAVLWVLLSSAPRM